MNGTPLNIIELLSGGNQLLFGDQSLLTGKEVESAPLSFDELIVKYLAGSDYQNNISDLLGVSGEAMVPFEQIPGNNTNFEKALLGQSYINNTINEDIPEQILPAKEQPDNVVSFNKELQQLNLSSNPTINKNLKNLFITQPVELPDGKYEVVQSKIIDGQLNLELKQDNSDADNIKLTVPLTQLKDGMKESRLNNHANTRLTLDHTGDDRKELNRLFSKIQLKEIVIENVKPENNVNKPGDVKFNIIVDDKGKEITLKNNLHKIHLKEEKVLKTEEIIKSDYYQTKTDNNGSLKILKESTKPENITRLSVDVNNTAVKSGIKGAVLDKNDTWIKNGYDLMGFDKTGSNINGNAKENLFDHQGLFEKFGNGANNFVESAKSENNEIVFSMNKIDLAESTEIKNVKSSQVRFILPENINSNLKPIGRSIMLKINPEHLGPARLNLTMINNKLKARVVVNSHAARIILENSVDRLIDQLQKVDIKVDLLDITVGGDSAKNELANHQSHWQRKIASRNLKLNNITDNNQKIISVTPLNKQPAGYLNAGGVNLLA